ncbi:MAG: hypothetical protein PHC61_09495 [Chitinivibrionales bacterium]|nr:hypothetical protein [Chitinivibrionales bacterium]
MIASQLGSPIKHIPNEKMGPLMDLKRQLDLPDPRLSGKECTLADMPENVDSITVCPGACQQGKGPCGLHGTGACAKQQNSKMSPDTASDTEALIKKITDEVIAALSKG